MYEELLIGLRGHAKRLGCDDRCPCYDADNRGYATCSEELAEKAADAIEELQGQIDGWIEQERKALLKSVPKWIPVTERCPEKSGDYLVFDDCRNLYVNEWHYLLKKWQYDDSRITHWMPLPEPPKEDA